MDFCRDPEAGQRIAEWADIIDTLDRTIRESEGMGGAGRTYYAFDKVVALAMLYPFRWVSATQARDAAQNGEFVTASAVEILAAINDTSKNRPDWIDPLIERAEAALADPTSDVAKCLLWVRTELAEKDENVATDYECNLVVLAKTGHVHSGQFALAASTFRAWKRVQADAADRATAANPQTVTGEHVGEVGGGPVNIPGCQCIEHRSLGIGDYGETFLIKFQSAAGNDLTWFASAGGAFDPEVGGTYDIRCSIKKHDTFNGRKVTLINRCKTYEPAAEKVKKPKKV